VLTTLAGTDLLTIEDVAFFKGSLVSLSGVCDRLTVLLVVLVAALVAANEGDDDELSPLVSVFVEVT
jgi:hypothetical protein